MFTRNWIVFGLIAGIIGDLAYFLAVAPLGLPLKTGFLLGSVFGPLLALGFVGLYHFFALYKKTVAIQASALFGVMAGTIVNMMIVVQGAIQLSIPGEARSGLGLAWDGVNAIQLGLDVSWDMYLSFATIFLGAAMFAHPKFGKMWGGATFAIGVGLLILNLLTFPVPPASAGLIDLGPICGIWYLTISIRALASLGWVNQVIAVNSNGDE